MIKIAIDFDDTFAYSSNEVTLVLYHIAKKFGLPFPHDDQLVELKGANRRDFYFNLISINMFLLISLYLNFLTYDKNCHFFQGILICLN